MISCVSGKLNCKYYIIGIYCIGILGIVNHFVGFILTLYASSIILEYPLITFDPTRTFITIYYYYI